MGRVNVNWNPMNARTNPEANQVPKYDGSGFLTTNTPSYTSTDKKQVINIDFLYNYDPRKPLPSKDLNGILTEGLYNYESTDLAAVANKPPKVTYTCNGFTLEVTFLNFKAGQRIVFQMFRGFRSDDTTKPPVVFHRSGIQTISTGAVTWSKWAEAGGGGGAIQSATAPDDVDMLWIDTANGGLLKYYNTTAKAWQILKATGVWG